MAKKTPVPPRMILYCDADVVRGVNKASAQLTQLLGGKVIVSQRETATELLRQALKWLDEPESAAWIASLVRPEEAAAVLQ